MGNEDHQMRNTAMLFLAGGLALATTAPAMAQDGLHAEVQGGYDHMALPDQTGNAPGATVGGSRAVYGVGAGYDVALGGPVFAGIDTNLDFGSKTSCNTGVVAAGDQLCGKLRNDWDVGARLGVHAGPARVYGRVAYDRTSYATTYTDPSANVSYARNTADGLRLGAGVEYDLMPNVYTKAEYRWTTASGVPDHNQVLAGVGLRF